MKFKRKHQHHLWLVAGYHYICMSRGHIQFYMKFTNTRQYLGRESMIGIEIDVRKKYVLN